MTNLGITKLFLKVVPTPLIAASPINSMADTTLIYVGELLAIPGKQPAKERTIVIEDGVIKSINKGLHRFFKL